MDVELQMKGIFEERICQEEEILIRKDDEKLINSGLSIWAAALTMFCIGFGTGTVTIPYTTKLVGLPLAFVILLTVFALCTLGSLLLCYSYNIVFKDVDHKTTIIRAPYGDMMERAFGQIGRIVHVVMFVACLLLLCVGFLSVLANTLDSLARNVVEEYPFILPFWAWCLLPTLIVMWGVLIRSPKGFVWISVFSGVTSILVACIIAIACFLVYSRSNLKTTIQEKGDDSGIFEKCNAIFTSAGVIAFAWCFQCTIPSIQTDMSNPNHAPKSSLMASLSLLFGYSISTIVAYLLIGGDLMKQSMIDTFIDLDLYASDAGFKTVVTLIQLFFICHLLSVLIPVINPLCQQMDEILGLPVTFTWHRVACRFTLILTVFGLTVALPDFIDVLSLCGGTLLIQLSITLPVLIYLKVNKKIAQWKKGVLGLTVLLTIFCSAAVSVTGFINIIHSNHA